MGGKERKLWAKRGKGGKIVGKKRETLFPPVQSGKETKNHVIYNIFCFFTLEEKIDAQRDYYNDT